LAELRTANERARECLADDVPPALIRQQAELARLAGDSGSAAALLDQADARPATARGAFFALLEQTEGGRWAGALPPIQGAARAGASREAAWLLLASAHAELGQHARAKFCAEMATSMRPDSAWAWSLRGVVAMTAGEHAEATGHFRAALRL